MIIILVILEQYNKMMNKFNLDKFKFKVLLIICLQN